AQEPESVLPSETPSEDEPSEPAVSGETSAEESPSEEPVTEEGSVLYRSMSLPESSTVLSHNLASQLLGFCSLGSENVARYLLESSGFEVQVASGFDKSPTDDSHTCAFIMGKGTLLYNGKLRTLFLIVVRGTSDAEWLSNFDFAPSENEHTAYAENFLACAEDVLSKTEDLLKEADEPLIAVCGHSRGAACANLAGVLLNRTFPVENTFVYTFATPTTVREREGFDNSIHRNIFNYLNPCDIVTKVPLEGWGFGRAGTDIVLEADEETAKKVAEAADNVAAAIPTIHDYYHTKHALTATGKDKDGMTAYEVMKQMADLFINPSMQLSGVLSTIDKKSAFYPLVTFFSGGSDTGLSLTVMMQHMPALYLLKIQALIQEEEQS
ncbi:MAG: hypothetical protein J5843_02005, partial [Clostridia bacterium]|nr:hypothetical protein [Clostridia bacterium]